MEHNENGLNEKAIRQLIRLAKRPDVGAALATELDHRDFQWLARQRRWSIKDDPILRDDRWSGPVESSQLIQFDRKQTSSVVDRQAEGLCRQFGRSLPVMSGAHSSLMITMARRLSRVLHPTRSGYRQFRGFRGRCWFSKRGTYPLSH